VNLEITLPQQGWLIIFHRSDVPSPTGILSISIILCGSVYVCLCVCVCGGANMHVCSCVCVWVCAYPSELCLYVCVSISVTVCDHVHVSFCVSLCHVSFSLSLFWNNCPCMYVFKWVICLWMFLSVSVYTVTVYLYKYVHGCVYVNKYLLFVQLRNRE